MRSLLAVLAVAITLRLHAGVVYDFVTTVESPRSRTKQTGRIFIDGQSYRADLNGRGGRDIDVVISRDGDQTAIFVDLQKCFWSYRTRIGPTRSSSYFHLPTDTANVIIGKPSVSHRIEGTEAFGEFTATKHVIEIAYRIVGLSAGSPVRGHIEAKATIWTVESLPPLPMRRELRTGHESVDTRIARVSSDIGGMIVHHELEVTRAYDGGIAQTERTITNVHNLRVTELSPSLFVVPEDAIYVQRAPGS